MADALEPLVYFQVPDGCLYFYNIIDDRELRNRVFRLSYAAQHELGLRKDNKLQSEEAEKLAKEISIIQIEKSFSEY